MLDILQRFLRLEGYSFSRIDGSVPINKRQYIMDDFNRNPNKMVRYLQPNETKSVSSNHRKRERTNETNNKKEKGMKNMEEPVVKKNKKIEREKPKRKE